MKTIKIIYSKDKNKRVKVIQREDDMFTFMVEEFSDHELEKTWIPYGRFSKCLCDNIDSLYKELKRIDWFNDENLNCNIS